MYCVYLTTYLGNKLPMFYIGSSSIIKMKGKGNPSFGKKLYNNGKINKRFKDEPVDKSWVLGGLPKKPEIKLTCHHCGITSNTGNIKRWHLDNCKLFPTI